MTIHAGAQLSVVAPGTSVPGRDAELARAEALLAAARAGTGGGVVVCGGPGVGKTLLLAEIAAMARGDGMTVLSGRGCALEGAFEFGLVRQALEPIVVSLEPALRVAALAGSAAPAGAVLAGAPGVGAEWRADPFAVLNGVFALVARLAARGPLVLALDDVDLADVPSLRMLAYTLRRVRSLPAVIVTTCRAPSVDAGVLATLGDGSEIFELGPLDAAAVAALVKDHLGGQPHGRFVDACAEQSGRNPFLLVELLETLRERGVPPVAEEVSRVSEACPDSVVRSVTARLWRAGTEAGSLARALAVAGECSELTQTARMAGLSKHAAAGAADALVAAGIIATNHPLRFSQPLVASAVQALLTIDQRRGAQAAVGAGVVSVLRPRAESHTPHTVVGLARAGGMAASRTAAAQAAPSGEPAGESLFRCDGDHWSVRYGNDAFRVRDSKGMRYIAELLAHPGREFAALALAAGIDGVAERCPAAARAAAEAGLGGSGAGDIGEILDPPARAAYRERLADLEEQAEEGDRFNDPERAARARAEIDALIRELSGALGLDGRSRRAPGPAERARQSVTKAIRSSVRRLGQHDRAIAAHLTRAIQTGAVCSYDPDPRARVDWTL